MHRLKLTWEFPWYKHSPLCETVSFIYNDRILFVLFFLFLCYTHRFVYEWKYSSDYPLLPTADELCTLFNWLCVSFNFLTAWSAGSVGPSKVSFDLALCLVSCFTPWAYGLLQDSFPQLLLLCLERKQVCFHMYYFRGSCDHRGRGNKLFHYNVHHCSSVYIVIPIGNNISYLNRIETKASLSFAKGGEI